MSGQTQHPLELTCRSSSGQLPGALLDGGPAWSSRDSTAPPGIQCPPLLVGAGGGGSGQTELQLEGGNSGASGGIRLPPALSRRAWWVGAGNGPWL